MSLLSTVDITGQMFRIMPYGDMVVAGSALCADYREANRELLRASNRDIPETIVCCGNEYHKYKQSQLTMWKDDHWEDCLHIITIYLKEGAEEPNEDMVKYACNAYFGQMQFPAVPMKEKIQEKKEIVKETMTFMERFIKRWHDFKKNPDMEDEDNRR